MAAAVVAAAVGGILVCMPLAALPLPLPLPLSLPLPLPPAVVLSYAPMFFSLSGRPRPWQRRARPWP